MYITASLPVCLLFLGVVAFFALMAGTWAGYCLARRFSPQ